MHPHHTSEGDPARDRTDHYFEEGLSLDEIVRRATACTVDGALLKQLIISPGRKITALYRKEHERYSHTLWPHDEIITFPNDPHLPWLKTLVDKEAMSSLFQQKVLAITPLSWYPGSRATLKYTCETGTFIGKTNKKNSRDTYKILAAINSNVIPKPLGCFEDLAFIYYEHLVGVPIKDLSHELLFSIGRSLSELHGCCLDIRKSTKADPFWALLKKAEAILACIYPEHRAEVREIVNTMKERIVLQDDGVIHGDFHKANLMMAAGEIKILDLDDVRRGDFRIDLGRFLASLRVMVLRKEGHLGRFLELKNSVIEGYGKPLNSLEEFEAAFLLTSATSPFRHQRLQWKEEGEALIQEALHLVSTLQSC